MINWFTVAAQIINFLILVALLKHFLYGPIVRAMDKREESIRNRLKDAKQRKQEAEQEADRYRSKTKELEEKQKAMLDDARRDVEQKQKAWLDDARRDVDDKRSQWEQSLERNRETLVRDIRDTIGREAVAVAGQTLSALAGAELDARATDAFLETLRQDDKERLQPLQKALSEAKGALTVRTAAGLSDDRQASIEHALKQQIEGIDDVSFETEKDLICGIEIAAGGARIGWSVRDYLDDIEDDVLPLLEQTARKPEDDDNND